MKIKKILMILMLLLISVGVLAGCGGYKLPDIFEEDEVIAAGEQVVDLINAGDYQTVFDMMREDLQEALTAEDLEAALTPILADMGEFQKIKASATAATTDDETGEEYGVVVLVAQYEHGSVQYTLSYDVDLHLVGIYAK